MANASARVIAFPGTYAQPGPYEYDNRVFTPEDMDEHDALIGAANRSPGVLQPFLPAALNEEAALWPDAA